MTLVNEAIVIVAFISDFILTIMLHACITCDILGLSKYITPGTQLFNFGDPHPDTPKLIAKFTHYNHTSQEIAKKLTVRVSSNGQ